PVGQAGPKSGGVVYTRWGRKSCPAGAELLYEGITGGSRWDSSGGGANYVCLPIVPQYLSTNEPTWYSRMYGTKYEHVNDIFPGKDNHNAPCAVCYTSTKSVKLMIPAKTRCPSSWTTEYKGYLMTNYYGYKSNKVYECVDENPESIDGSGADVQTAAQICFTRSTCNGLPCPPYVSNRAITCVVCTK
ncbi:PREDICTED: short-chain collagen C4-like, partial [Amphimedon queenslandica]|uniref:Short-chain collagen C4-like n=2 Tax=Amphimedon queenslandica TaxID=400682 RepID=A0AAN0IJ83_AMPQE